jgi:hypothetical protein
MIMIIGVMIMMVSMPELNVVKVYLKQGMELKNTAALGEALRKLDTLTGYTCAPITIITSHHIEISS